MSDDTQDRLEEPLTNLLAQYEQPDVTGEPTILYPGSAEDLAVALVAALRQSQDMEAAALDAAWKSAEQSLPEHFVIRRLERQTDGRWEVWSGVPDPRSPTADYGYGIGKGDGGWGGDWAEGPTLVDALRVLAALAPKAEEAPR